MTKNQFPDRLRRRSGRTCRDYNVILAKPAHEYVTGETFSVVLNNREVPVHVEIPSTETEDGVLYVA